MKRKAVEHGSVFKEDKINRPGASAAPSHDKRPAADRDSPEPERVVKAAALKKLGMPNKDIPIAERYLLIIRSILKRDLSLYDKTKNSDGKGMSDE
jgi:hypothetical protein